MAILIPALEPDWRLVDLVRALREAQPESTVIVVDDGSGPRYHDIFESAHVAGAEVLTLSTNKGKGYALRMGIAHIAAVHPDQDVVCADCDGQHTPDDIARIGKAVAQHRDQIILGSRRFTGHVPVRSRIGNTVTRHVFRLVTGSQIFDTQTGLRGYPAPLSGWLQTVRGNRFEYELEVLLEAQRHGIKMTEIPIATIYEDTNSSHFRTVRDSVRVYLPFLRLSLSPITSFTIDLAMLVLMMAVTGNVVVSVVASRLTSALFNLTTNRQIIARADEASLRTTAPRTSESDNRLSSAVTISETDQPKSLVGPRENTHQEI